MKKINTRYIRSLDTLTLHDIPLVGGKTASLGEMAHALATQGVKIPDGFAITADAYRHFLETNKLDALLQAQLARIDYTQGKSVAAAGKAIRALFLKAQIPEDLNDEILDAFDTLGTRAVAVRSSATAEDLPTASFAGQQESYLNVSRDALLDACKRCFASLFTDRAMMYRHEQGFDQMAVALSICVQKMVDATAAGVIFTVDTETGSDQVITINAVAGLGESLVQGSVNPDEYVTYKKKLRASYPVLKQYAAGRQFVLADSELQELTRLALIIEHHYDKAMDIEWARGHDGTLYIVQARPETVHAARKHLFVQYKLEKKGEVLVSGLSIGQKIAQGRARVVRNKDELGTVAPDDIIVTSMTDPDWMPFLRRAAGIVTDIGGRTCHAAIVSRELGIPAIIGTIDGTHKITDGATITIDASQGSTGFVYAGHLPFTTSEFELSKLQEAPVDIMVNLADPAGALRAAQLPVAGVGLARLEFIINNSIGIHPMAAVALERVADGAVKEAILAKAAAYASVHDFFVSELAHGVAMIAAAFYPRPVIVRLSDFKSNEYRHLLGGTFFEPQEENPMLGLRGAARYTSAEYAPAFALECAALRRVYHEMGFDNIRLMVPFVRTVAEAQSTIELLAQHALARGTDSLKLFMMVEIPSNVLLLAEFAQHFDGFSIGSNDLTQLTLGVDRDSGLMHHLFDERDPAVKIMLKMAIERAQAAKKYIGICGQAPSDYPEIAQFLIDAGINSISLSVDAVMGFIFSQSARN